MDSKVEKTTFLKKEVEVKVEEEAEEEVLLSKLKVVQELKEEANNN